MKSHDICQTSCSTKKLLGAGLPDDHLLLICNHLSTLSDRTRLRIFWALSNHEELCVCDVATGLDVTVALASHHLRKMRDAGFLQQRNEGKLVYYSLRPVSATSIMLDCIKSLLDQARCELAVGFIQAEGLPSQAAGGRS